MEGEGKRGKGEREKEGKREGRRKGREREKEEKEGKGGGKMRKEGRRRMIIAYANFCPRCLPLIIPTSFAPSPMANVTTCLFFFTRSTTFFFCRGVTRQQMTAAHWPAVSRRSSLTSSFRAWRCSECTVVRRGEGRGREEGERKEEGQEEE